MNGYVNFLKSLSVYQENRMNDLPKDQTFGRLPDASRDPAPIFLPKNPSDRDISLINKMVREELYYPPARKRTPSHEQQRRTRVKQKKKLASPWKAVAIAESILNIFQ